MCSAALLIACGPSTKTPRGTLITDKKTLETSPCETMCRDVIRCLKPKKAMLQGQCQLQCQEQFNTSKARCWSQVMCSPDIKTASKKCYSISGATEQRTRVLKKLAKQSKYYYESEQNYHNPHARYDPEPWHKSSGRFGMPNSPGKIVPKEELVFPGGRELFFRSTTHSKIEMYRPDIPMGGMRYKFMRRPERQNAFQRALLSWLFFEDYLYHRYTLTTGTSIGANATMRITAEADFIPGDDLFERAWIDLHVDANTGKVVISKITVQNEGH